MMILSLSFGLLLRMSTFQIAYAHNCNLFERGSDSWLACKEDDAEMEKWRERNSANLRQLQAETAAALTADVQTEQITQAIQAAAREQQRQKSGGN